MLGAVHARFAAANPELPNGFAEHTPMGAEAMLSLGLDPGAVAAWAARHEPVALAPDAPLAVRRDALRAEMDRSWQDVLTREVSALAPHVGAHLFHGVIRTAHAVRALGTGVTDAGLDELAVALAAWDLWAGAPARTGGAAAAGGGVVEVLDAARRGAGACATSPTIVHIHAVTAPMAFMLLVPHVDGATVAAAALAFGRTHARYPEPSASTRGVPPSAADLSQLLDHWDAHPAKLTEAALRGFAYTGDGVFLDAVAAIMGR